MENRAGRVALFLGVLFAHLLFAWVVIGKKEARPQVEDAISVHWIVREPDQVEVVPVVVEEAPRSVAAVARVERPARVEGRAKAKAPQGASPPQDKAVSGDLQLMLPREAVGMSRRDPLVKAPKDTLEHRNELSRHLDKEWRPDGDMKGVVKWEIGKTIDRVVSTVCKKRPFKCQIQHAIARPPPDVPWNPELHEAPADL